MKAKTLSEKIYFLLWIIFLTISSFNFFKLTNPWSQELWTKRKRKENESDRALVRINKRNKVLALENMKEKEKLTYDRILESQRLQEMKEKENPAAVNLSFSFRTPSTSWLPLPGINRGNESHDHITFWALLTVSFPRIISLVSF